MRLSVKIIYHEGSYAYFVNGSYLGDFEEWLGIEDIINAVGVNRG